MQLFYNTTLTPTSTNIVFDKDASRHISKVLRKEIGTYIDITDGVGNFYKAILKDNNPKKCIGDITEIFPQKPMAYNLHIAVAPTKLNDRYEWFLEKATEIGVTQITPIICNHSERKVIKHDRYEKIIISAAKQSQKAFFPKLNNAVTFDEFLKRSKDSKAIKCIAHCEERKKETLKSIINSQKEYIILIGPEGDFSSKEIDTAILNKYKPISLGTSRLRTETAAIIACHSIKFALEK